MGQEMSKQPVHEIKVEHRWQEVDRVNLDSGSYRTTERCLDCDAEIEILHLESDGGPSLSELPPKELATLMADTNRALAKISADARSMFQRLVEESGYETFEELEIDINRKLGGEVNASELPFFQLEILVNSRHLKEQKKVALAFRQGLICNKCKTLVYSLSELTLDHIVPESDDGKKLLPNLQLFCPTCNECKADSAPTASDISPFRFVGEPTVFSITCVDVDRMRKSRKGGT